MTSSVRLLPRLRVGLLTLIFTVTAVGLDAAPVTPPAPAERDETASAPLPFGLGPDPARAAYCASNPTFTGRLTASSGSTTAVSRITNANVYGYISNVDAAWSCTLYRRYSAVAWNTTASLGRFNWGTIINSTSVGCNWLVGTTDYLKANDTADCADSDAEYAMQVTLTAERVYRADNSHDDVGDFSFAHADCDTTPYYGDELAKGTEASPVSFSTGSTSNRPGANCDPITIDGTGTTQTITYDATAPSTAFDWPAAGGPTAIPSAFYTVQFDATDAVAGFDATHTWSLQRQKATWNGTACGTFANDGSAVTGTTNAANQVVSQSLATDSCYRWTLGATDANGNAATTKTSGSVAVDTTAHLGQQAQHTFESWDLGAGDSLDVNVGTGNLVLSHPVVDLPIRGSTVDIALTYNRHDATSVGMGPGWRLNLHRRLALNGDGSVTFTGADGARHRFTNPVVNGTVTTYSRPATLYATLVKDTNVSASEFVLSYRDQSKDEFDILGSEAILVREEDRFGNGVDVTYVGGTNRISKVRDTAANPAREIDFGYDASNRVTSITDWAWVSGGVIQTGASGARRVNRFFYDAGGNLAGWADPLNTSGSCPTGGSHLTCLTYTATQLDVAKTQTVTTIGGSPAALGTMVRGPGGAEAAVTTRVTFTGSDVTNVKDGQELFAGATGTAFSHPNPAQTQVVRQGLGTTADPHTTTRYTLVASTDPYARIASVKRKLGASWIERATTWDTTYPIEPASVTDNEGALLSTPARTVSYTYVASSLGLVARMVEPLDGTYSRWTDYTYNANNDVTQTIVSRQGSPDTDKRTITRYCYTTQSNTCPLTETGLTVVRRVDNWVSGATPDENTMVMTDFTSDAYGQQTRQTRHNRGFAGATIDDRVDESTFDDKGNLTSSIINYVNGTVTSPGDDVTPNATSGARTDLTTSYTHDTAGNQVSAADPRRAVEAAKGTSLAADDFISRSTYDALNHQLTDTTPTTPGITIAQKTASTTYDEFGLVRSATDFGGLVAASEYDRAGRGTRTFEDPDGAGSTAAAVTSATTYDPSGRVLTTADQLQVANPTTLGVTQSEYDELGRPVKSTAAYRPPPNTLPDESTTFQTYDALDRLTSEEVGYPSGQVTSNTYDLGGRTIETDDGFACSTATFDYRDLALTVTSGLVGGTCASGADTRTVTNSYDGLARLTRSEVTAGTGTGDRTFDGAFDSAGRALTSGVRTGGVTSTSTFVYNPLDQVLRETRPDGSSAKTIYDPAANATDRCYWKPGISVGNCYPEGTTPWTNPPTQVTTTTYDARNQRVELRDSVTNTVTTYDPAHNYLPAAFYVPTGTGKEHQTLYGYDGEHRLTSITKQLCAVSSGHACSSTTATGSDTYAYDDDDHRTTVVESNGATNSDRRYCYDALHRLIFRNTGAACSAAAKDESYTYDDAGNRLTAPGQTFTYNPSGQLTGCTTTCGTITYDAAGNTARLKGWSYEYDSEDGLVRACKASSCTGTIDKVEFAYDGAGHRTQTKEYVAGVLTTTRDFRYQGDAIVEESTNGSVSRGYVVDEAGQILKVCDPSCASPTTTYLVSWNGHGDATALYRINTDGTLTLANTYTYSSWGEPTTTTHAGIGDLAFRYLYLGAFGVQWDNFSGLGLQFMQARHYSPLIGRFLQPDPSAEDESLYAYAASNPISQSDADGTHAEKLAQTGGPGGGVGPVRPIRVVTPTRTTVTAKIGPGNIGRGTEATKAAKTWVKRVAGKGYDAGHIIARVLGGRGGRYSGNIAPMRSVINQEKLSTLEKNIASAVRSGRRAEVRVTLYYRRGADVPYFIKYQYRLYGGNRRATGLRTFGFSN